mmetsp:Transcript_17363/g.46310  ORF Transcript_17363/g.46310 Transcript_17363/m.46310 type:complete len:142 (+) Transcript_17363:788-1213(+)
MDMSQNVGIPSLGSDQYGDDYYHLPLNQNIFGITNNATKRMNCYIWKEGMADRGADNIVSCLYWDLERRGIFDGKVRHLVIIADNCRGQNKNICVQKFLMWLVETGFANKLTLLFLIKGHTKNICDRLFNLLTNAKSQHLG